MENKVKEMYEGDFMMNTTKYLLMIYEDGSVRLKWYCGNTIIERANPVLVPVEKGLRIQYGDSTVKCSLPFSRVSDGVLDKHWTKIK